MLVLGIQRLLHHCDCQLAWAAHQMPCIRQLMHLHKSCCCSAQPAGSSKLSEDTYWLPSTYTLLKVQACYSLRGYPHARYLHVVCAYILSQVLTALSMQLRDLVSGVMAQDEM